MFPIPSMWFSCGTISSFSNLSNPAYVSSAVKEYWQIGMDDDENLNTTGVPQLSGRLSRTISTYDRMSFTASSMSLPHSISNVTIDILSFEVEYRCFRWSTEFKAFSITLLTLVSISDADAPG